MFTSPVHDDENDNVHWAETAVREAERLIAQQVTRAHHLEAKGYPEAAKALELLAVLTETLQLKRQHLLIEVALREQRRRRFIESRTPSDEPNGGSG